MCRVNLGLGGIDSDVGHSVSEFEMRKRAAPGIAAF